MHIKSPPTIPSPPPSSPSSKTAQKDPQSYYLILWYCAHVQASLKTTIFLQIFSNLEVNHLKNSLWMDVCIVGFAGQLLVVVSQLLSSTGDQYQVIPTSPIKNCIGDIRRETRIFSVFHENFPHLLLSPSSLFLCLRKDQQTDHPSKQSSGAICQAIRLDRPTVRSSVHPSGTSLCGEKINEEFNLI